MLLLSAVPGLPREISAKLSLEEKDLEPPAVFWFYGKKTPRMLEIDLDPLELSFRIKDMKRS